MYILDLKEWRNFVPRFWFCISDDTSSLAFVEMCYWCSHFALVHQETPLLLHSITLTSADDCKNHEPNRDNYHVSYPSLDLLESIVLSIRR